MTLLITKHFFSALAYTSRPYSYTIVMQPIASYIPYNVSFYEQTGGIITFEQFEEGNLVEK